MQFQPNQQLLGSELVPSLESNIASFRTIFQLPQNKDVVIREFVAGSFPACLLFIEGMAGSEYINDNVLYPCRVFEAPEYIPGEIRADYLAKNVLNISDISLDNRLSELTTQLLSGKTILLVDGCAEGVVMETRKYEKRNVDKTNTESVVSGAQQGFVENLRTNITLLRRILHSPMLISEISTVGTQLPTSISIVYLKGVANERVLKEVRRRLQALDVGIIPDSGHLQQLIEERPFMLLPQTLQTERPDRTAYLLSEGRIAIMVDNSPYALIVPVSLFDFLQTADDAFMRWQYGLFNQIVRILAMVISLVLPGIYLSMTLYHSQMIPIELLSSIAVARADVPFPVIVEVLIMEFAFYLINEAGTRLPSQIGSALGILGALILGQAAVAASIISPIMIIIAALSGLGNYAIPDYGLGIAVQILRLGLLFAGALFGLFGVSCCMFLYLCLFCSMESFGEPYMAPIAPWRPHYTDMILKYPVWMSNQLPYHVNRGSWLKRSPNGKKMRAWEDRKK